MICEHCNKNKATFDVPQNLCEECWQNWFDYKWSTIEDLLFEWADDTKYLSCGYADHTIYQQIVDIGDDAIPELIRFLPKYPLHCIPALHGITGAQPIPKEDRGRLVKMIEAWQKWAKDNDYES